MNSERANGQSVQTWPTPQFEDSRKLLVMLSRLFHKRCIAGGAKTVDVQDVYQEMCVAWCKARDKWTPEYTGPDGQVKKVPFSAYLSRGVRNHVNRWLDYEIMTVQDVLELDAAAGVEDDGDFHSMVADMRAPSPEALAIESNDRDNLELILSAEAKQFIGFLESPPPVLFQALDAMKARRQYAVDRGVTASAVTKKITASLVFDLMGCNQQARSRIAKEIKQFCNLELLANG